mmetsp:Transcript_59568/g.136640  ORF Transcript_59568/g.136640 Transcript_59568/m.136640 type:complete len:581 (-) Transcript_59568:515-2257(-)
MKTVPVQKPAAPRSAQGPTPPPVADGVRHHLHRPSSARSFFGRRPESAAGSGNTQSTSVLIARIQNGGGKQRLRATEELSHLLSNLRDSAAAAAYQDCSARQLVPWLLQSLSESELQKDSPQLQATLSCLTNLACLGGPRQLIDTPSAAILVSVLRASGATGNQGSVLACLLNLAQNPMCVNLLRGQQAELPLKTLARSHNASLRVPAASVLRAFQEVPDSTLQVSFKTLRSQQIESSEYLGALHGISRFLGCMSPNATHEADRQEALSALAFCEREGLLSTLVPILQRERQLRLEQAGSDSDVKVMRPGYSRAASGLDNPTDRSMDSPRQGLAEMRASSFRLDPSRRSVGTASILEQLALSCLANLSAIGGGESVQPHGAVRCMLDALGLEDPSRRYALVGLSNSCSHEGARLEMKADGVAMSLLKRLVAAKGVSADTLAYAGRILATVKAPGGESAGDHFPVIGARDGALVHDEPPDSDNNKRVLDSLPETEVLGQVKETPVEQMSERKTLPLAEDVKPLRELRGLNTPVTVASASINAKSGLGTTATMINADDEKPPQASVFMQAQGVAEVEDVEPL